MTKNESSQPKLWPVATVMATGIFATTFVQTQALAFLPLNHLLKSMGLDSDKAATFLSLCILPWSFKIIAGLLVDGLPIFGSRRRAYLLLSGLIASATWLAMGFSPGKYNLLLSLAIAMNVAVVFGSTTSGGLLVEAGQAFGASGRLSSLRMVGYSLGGGLAMPVGGWLAGHTMEGNHPLLGTSIVAVVPLACMFFAAWSLLKEPGMAQLAQGPAPAKPSLHIFFSIWQQLKNVLRREMLLPALLMFFIQAVPTFRSTCFYQYQTGPLHYSDDAIGWLGFVGYGASLLGSGIYAWWCRRASLRVSLHGAVLATSLSALPYLFYPVYTPYMPGAMAIESVGNLLQFLAYLPLLDLAVRGTPKGSEALGYSVLIGVWNIGLMIGMKTGPMLYEHAFHKNMNALIWLNAGVTLAGVALVFLLPRALVAKREGA